MKSLKMSENIRRSAFLSLILISVGSSNSILAIDDSACSTWSIVKLNTMPAWYMKKLEIRNVEEKVISNGDAQEIQYVLSDSSKVVSLQLREPIPIMDSDSNVIDWESNGKLLYITTKDTLILDSTKHIFSPLSLAPDGLSFVCHEVEYVGEDVIRGDIVQYSIPKRMKQIIFKSVGYSEPAISPDGTYLAFSDFGDLYIYNISLESPECIFQKGGSYALGSNCPSQEKAIKDIAWSDDGKSLDFKFFSAITKGDYIVYEVSLRQ